MNELQKKADKLIKDIEAGNCDAKYAENAFREFAEYFLGHVVFKSKNNGEIVYRPVEIEMYYHSKNHPDPYVHKHEAQLKNQGFYWHGAGVDVALGKKDKDENSIFFGVLISGIVENSEKYCYKKIDIHEKIKDCDCEIKLDKKGNETCYRSTRVNLNYNVLDIQPNPYIARLYRFANALPSNQGMYDKTKFSFYFWLDCIENNKCKEKPDEIERTRALINEYIELHCEDKNVVIQKLEKLGFKL